MFRRSLPEVVAKPEIQHGGIYRWIPDPDNRDTRWRLERI